jgi:hypothetical protein
VEQRLQSLQALVSPALRALDFSDDRLASVLDYLGAVSRPMEFVTYSPI